jgi:hypothetical protein
MTSAGWLRNLLEALVEGIAAVFGKGRGTTTGSSGSRRIRRRQKARQDSRGPQNLPDRGKEHMHRRMMGGRH